MSLDKDIIDINYDGGNNGDLSHETTSIRTSIDFMEKVTELSKISEHGQLKSTIVDSVRGFSTLSFSEFNYWITNAPTDNKDGGPFILPKMQGLFMDADRKKVIDRVKFTRVVFASVYWNYDRLVKNLDIKERVNLTLVDGAMPLSINKSAPANNKSKQIILNYFNGSFNTRLIGPPSSGKSYHCSSGLKNTVKKNNNELSFSQNINEISDIYILNNSVEAGVTGTTSSRLILGLSFNNGKHSEKVGLLLRTIIESLRNPDRTYIFILDDCHNQPIELMLSPLLPILKNNQRFSHDEFFQFESLNKNISYLSKIKNISTTILSSPMADDNDYCLSLPDNFFLCLTSNINENSKYSQEWADRFSDIKFYPYVKVDDNIYDNEICEFINEANKIIYESSVSAGVDPLLLMVGQYSFVAGFNSDEINVKTAKILNFILISLVRNCRSLFVRIDIDSIILKILELVGMEILVKLFDMAAEQNPFIDRADLSEESFIRIISSV